ncbi:MAG: thiamine-phosphate kinase [Deltaproteobacteria bacterium]|nr:thiamine-phosphate kinase [Deltaproteobacteria bacterium]
MFTSKEWTWIQKAQKIFGPPGPFWQKGIGDDGALWSSTGSKNWVWSQDALVEGVHFRLNRPSAFRDAGFKALTVNLSDLAAMGALPRGALVALALPPKVEFAQFKAFCQGLAQASRLYCCPIVGGDLSKSPHSWMASVSILGEAPWGAIGRDGARPGDEIWVSGPLGEAALGLGLLEKPLSKLAGRQTFEKKQSRPKPRVDLVPLLCPHWKLTSLLDLSDGLWPGLTHLAQASQVGFVVNLAHLKPKKSYLRLCESLQLDPWQLILAGGEDYELLWTLSPEQGVDFRAWLRKKSLSFKCLGKITRNQKAQLWLGDRPYTKKIKGFAHF